MIKAGFGRILRCAMALLLLCAPPLWAQSPVWRIANDSGVLYLGATVHMLRPGDLPLPEAFDKAYAKSDVLLFEVDLGDLAQPEVQALIAQGMLYAEGGRLSDQLSESSWQRLEHYAVSRGLAPQMLQSLRPSGVFLTLLGIEMVRLGATEAGVDMRLYRQALDDGKPVIGLETIRQHLQYLFSMGEEDPDLFLTQVLDELEVDSSTLDSLIDAWRRGDEAQLYDELVLQLKLDYEPLYRTLVLERNRLWWSQIEILLNSPQTELVLVGAAHLVGPEGLLSRARGLGFSVEAMQ
ncbi:TraB/GumN family protein [Marinobacterium sedimentorum]|uniref:TraB/GumN family protein n=1 Tax=Marinobacterium sedimentorum TaxID=2927804 RepID=UPI0020C6AE0A|nr:TraB/GumN family protein [Marinobacterium sedimentorum]MCP8688782.1 TraB/GumN family protein [Marinobacterium sedimentorum]